MYNDKIQKIRRRELRKNQTEVEKLLWERLRDRQLNKLKFRRQYSVGPYILDFFCADKRLAIELDGEQHKDAKEYDRERENYLKNKDIKILRFWNGELENDVEEVLRVIQENAKF